MRGRHAVARDKSACTERSVGGERRAGSLHAHSCRHRCELLKLSVVRLVGDRFEPLVVRRAYDEREEPQFLFPEAEEGLEPGEPLGVETLLCPGGAPSPGTTDIFLGVVPGSG